jgi:hypothetical protein
MSESQHTKVRDFVVQWMTENSSKIESTFGKDYLIQSGMTDDGVWATEAEILATAAALNTDIFIFCKVGKLNKWLNADVENQANYGVSVKPFTLTTYYIKRLSYSKNGLYKGVKL